MGSMLPYIAAPWILWVIDGHSPSILSDDAVALGSGSFLGDPTDQPSTEVLRTTDQTSHDALVGLGVRWSSSPAKPPGFFPECIQHPIVGIEDTHTMIWNLEIPRKCRHIQQTMWGFNIPPVPPTTTKSKMTWSALFLSIKPINCWSRSTDGDSIPNKKWQNTLIPCENSFCVNCDLVNYT